MALSTDNYDNEEYPHGHIPDITEPRHSQKAEEYVPTDKKYSEWLGRFYKPCTHLPFIPKDYEADYLSEGQLQDLEQAEADLVALFGEAWCHRDDANPMERLYANHSGEHHTVREWIVTKVIFRNFHGFY